MTDNLSVKVAVRVRPLVASERDEGCDVVLNVDKKTNQVFSNSNNGRMFAFDHTFSQTSTQEEIYTTCVQSLEERLFQGFNATLLAYGQTGSGKTYTMGTSINDSTGVTQGIIPRTIKSIFNKIHQEKENGIAENILKVSFVEIHNEELRDLLIGTNDNDVHNSNNSSSLNQSESENSSQISNHCKLKQMKLSIREDKNGTVYVAGLVEKDVPDEETFEKLLQYGSTKRATASTSMNSVSSRSHAILTVTLHRRQYHESNENVSNELETTSHFRLVDLAGSERAKRTNASGARLKEGININKGLLALGNVISILGCGPNKVETTANSSSTSSTSSGNTNNNNSSSSSSSSSKQHVPYRNSKLTRILQSSLGGNSCTVMIACVSPADSNFDESWNTLRYASRAR
jgi:hypothetical protein